jgi:hypothetical protein
LPEQSTATHARAQPAATLAFHGWFTCRQTVKLSAKAAAQTKRASHHSEALPALEQQRRRVVGDVQHVFDLARHLARRFLGGRPVGVPDLMNKTNFWLQSYMRRGARLICSCSLLAEGLLDGELLAVGRDVMRPLDDDACAAPAGGVKLGFRCCSQGCLTVHTPRKVAGGLGMVGAWARGDPLPCTLQ